VTLTDKDIKNFRAIYKEQYGTNISKQEAVEQGLKLFNLLSVVYKPITIEQADVIDKHRQNTLKDLESRISEKN